MQNARSFVATMCVLSFGCAVADVFPNDDSSGELSSAVAWGSPDWFSTVSPYGNAAHDLELNAEGQYSITGDVAFAQFINSIPKNNTAVIDCTKGDLRPKVSLTGLRGNATANIHNTTLQLVGGDWDLGGGNVDYGTYYASDRKIVLDNHAVVTNVGQLNLSKTSLVNNEVILQDGSKMFVSGAVNLGAQRDGTLLRVLGGSTFYHEGGSKMNFNTGAMKANIGYWDGRNGIVASNANTRVSIAMGDKALFILGNGPAGGLLHVTDHAFVEVGGESHVGNGSSSAVAGACGSNTFIRVENGGSLNTEVVYFPYGPTYGDISGGNRFEVLSGGAYTNAGASAFHLRERGNAFVVSNGVAAVGNFRISGSDNEIVLQGACPQIVCTAGTGHGFDMADGANALRFEVPSSGYDADFIPLVSDKNINFGVGAQLEITGLDGVLAKMEEDGVRTKTMTLLKASNKLNGLEPIIAGIEETHALPDGCSLSVSGKSLILTCKLKQGLILLLR